MSSFRTRTRCTLEDGALIEKDVCSAAVSASRQGRRSSGEEVLSRGSGEDRRQGADGDGGRGSDGGGGGGGGGGRNQRLLHSNLVVVVFVVLALLAGMTSLASCLSFEDHDWVHGNHRSSFIPLAFKTSDDSIRGQNHIDSIHRRRLKGNAQMPLFGGVLYGGYYYAYVYLGTPPKRFALIVDTGSTVLYVPCSTCLKCGTHQDLAFAPKASTTYKRIPCSRSCDQCSDDAPRQCMYQRHYAEDSTSKGLLASDVIGFGNRSSVQGARINFGCELFESGDIYLQRADGIIGLGRGTLSVVDQLVSQQAMDDSFSICYGGMGDGGMGEMAGALMLGSSLPPIDMKFTPLDLQKSYYYCVVLDGVRLNGETLDVPAEIYTEGYGAVLDSGTTFAYLPSQAFHAFKKKVVATIDLERVDGPDPNFQDICFAGASSDFSELGDFFPTVEFVFQGNVSISLTPENYLFVHKKRPGAYCFGFFKNPDRGTLIGGIAVRNMLVTYDRANAKVGFAPRKCSTLLDSIPPVIPSTTSYASTGPPDSVSSTPASNSYPAPVSQSSPESSSTPASVSVSQISYPALPPAPNQMFSPGSDELPPWSAPPSGPLFVTPKRPSEESRPLIGGVDRANLSQPVTSEQVENGGNENPSANTTSPPQEVCHGCALKILVNVTLLEPVTFDTELRSGFIDDMARELGLAVPQVVVMKYSEDIQCVQCAILPEKSRLYLPANVTTGIVNRLQNKTAVHFRDAVGDYNVTDIYVVPVSPQSLQARSFWKPTSGGGIAVLVVASVAGLIVIGAVIGFFISRLKRYSSYRTVSEIQFEEDDRIPRF